MNGDQEIVSLVARLGLVPLEDDVPGLQRIREMAPGLQRIRGTPDFEDLVSRRTEEAIDAAEFLAGVDALIASTG